MSELNLSATQPNASPSPEGLAKGPGASASPGNRRKRASIWICVVIAFGVIAWRGVTEREYWGEVWQQKTLFPTYKVPTRIEKGNLD
jgi:hypothetical protein